MIERENHSVYISWKSRITGLTINISIRKSSGSKQRMKLIVFPGVHFMPWCITSWNNLYKKMKGDGEETGNLHNPILSKNFNMYNHDFYTALVETS
ncbi:hypothetical protein V6N13_110055 [Hibiscus sabdariffa]|uniref:Uncharacterized protein n=2 Tax=Hibiscus sabdariffa TaxID=183260 RepID=A0ABR2A448_9ROSI